jgi:tripartite-type tricarboxylate transporter receptor subunit TctC
VLGVPIVVENKPAAGGILANSILAKAPPDGHTLVVLSSTFTTGAAIRTNLPYNAQTSFVPVAMLAKGPLLITVSQQTPFRTLQELIVFAKANPAKLNYGTSGVGSINQFATEILAEAAQIKLTHVPYKGMSPALTDLIGGQIDILIASAPSLLAQVNANKIRGLAVGSVARSEVAPSLPALGELGFVQSAVELWWGVLAPANTPAAIVTRLNREINAITTSTEMKAFFIKEGASPAPISAEAFAEHIDTELKRWKLVAQAADIQPE